MATHQGCHFAAWPGLPAIHKVSFLLLRYIGPENLKYSGGNATCSLK
jgi:hypothetical protein